ncbi:SRPBCC family protein [Micromonospora matsumotoense]|uniref:SRPBCC family protein n=1 Tax=Micromonospora matsumotoense TaxID=121616 RepID=UPI003D938F7B
MLRSLRAARLSAALALPLVTIGALGVPSPASADDGTSGRVQSTLVPLTCAGRGVDPAAKIRYRTETLIKAPLHAIWKLQTDVERWPSWQPLVATAKRLDRGALRAGSQFRWTTPVPETPNTPATRA